MTPVDSRFILARELHIRLASDRSAVWTKRTANALQVSSPRSTKMTTSVNAAKKIDLPPRGDRNTDPISEEAGAHPIETGIGAAVAGTAVGIAAGAVGGPFAAAIGVAVGAVAGGYAGKNFGEVIDPTLDDNWLRDHFRSPVRESN